MKPSEIRNLSLTEQTDKIADIEGEMLNLRFQAQTGKLDNPMRMRMLRRDIARLKTIVRESLLRGKKTVVMDGGDSPPSAVPSQEGREK